MPMPVPEFVPPGTMEVLFSKEQIAERVATLGKEISEEYKGESIVLIGVL